MPPVLDQSKNHRDGLAFIGLSLSRYSELGHSSSVTHQVAFDLNEVQDREYKYLASTNDDGWLVGGGEPGAPKSYKLAAPDSGHVEIMRIGTYEKEWGGLSREELIECMKLGKIMIPQITALPTSVIANGDVPPELEIRFDMDPEELKAFLEDHENAKIPDNWALTFIHNQLFRTFEFASRFCPGPFHSTIVRKAEFRSVQHKNDYFKMCAKAIQCWKLKGPQALQAPEPGSCTFASGVYLFTDRNTITHKFEPNFLPPYDTREKRQVIYNLLKEKWDEKTLSFQPVLKQGWPLSSGGCSSAGSPDDKYATCNLM